MLSYAFIFTSKEVFLDMLWNRNKDFSGAEIVI